MLCSIHWSIKLGKNCLTHTITGRLSRNVYIDIKLITLQKNDLNILLLSQTHLELSLYFFIYHLTQFILLFLTFINILFQLNKSTIQLNKSTIQLNKSTIQLNKSTIQLNSTFMKFEIQLILPEAR